MNLRKGYHSEPETLATAFAGAGILFLVSLPFDHELRVKNDRNAIDAAKRVGVKQLFFTILAFAGPPTSPHSVAAVMQAHIDRESYLKNSGLGECAVVDPSLSIVLSHAPRTMRASWRNRSERLEVHESWLINTRRTSSYDRKREANDNICIVDCFLHIQNSPESTKE